MLSPEDIARYGDESIVVLDKIRHTLQFFNTKGDFLPRIDLDDTWKRKPNYPTNITEGSQGGFVIYDFHAECPLVRTDAQGRIQSGYGDVYLVEDLQKVVRKISRRPDGMWLERASSISAAPDGSVTVLATNQSGEGSVNTFGPDGAPRTTYICPRDWCFLGQAAYDGQSVFVKNGNMLYIVGPNSTSTGSFQLPFGSSEKYWGGPFLAAKNTKLWFVDYKDLTVHRYAIPRSAQSSDSL